MENAKLIQVDEEKCNNCHSCISVCPVKTCIDGSGDKVAVIAERCIGCGQCIPACKQQARSIVDDTAAFFKDLSENVPMVAIVAPAVAAVFDDSWLKLNGYLKSIGVKAVFDVSFGAELTAKSYLDYAKREKPKTIIAQPCAALVSYCQMYNPELLQYLAPAHSPMLHTAAMIREFFPEYKNCRIAAISPCTSKKREFEETGLIRYNVTMIHLKEEMEKRKVSLSSFSPLEYDGPRAERAVLFSTPGGLKETVIRDAPDITPKIRRIEGPEIVYDYLNEIPRMVEENVAPFIVDCLNCSAGCNGGPGTGNYNQPIDRLEARVEKRKKAEIRENKRNPLRNPLKTSLKKFWKPGLYNRNYVDLSGQIAFRTPNKTELEEIYRMMKKHSQEDMLNCSACGYFTCQGMAEAIYNGLNRPENCHQYLKVDAEENLREGAANLANSLISEIEKSKHMFEELHTKMSQFLEINGRQDDALRKSNMEMEELIRNIQAVSSLTEEKRRDIDNLGHAAIQVKKDMQDLLKSLSDVEHATNNIAGIADIIEDVASSTNLLAMNAAIEAAHAGNSGRGFAVVANEIRGLSGTTGKNAGSITQNIKEIISQIGTSLSLSGKTDTVMTDMISSVDTAEKSFSEILKSHTDIADRTKLLTSDLNALDATAETLRSSSQAIIAELDSMKTLIETLGTAADAAKSQQL
ncbi:[Fe-Fe] hydrogenase large subunit C-terminal domain-containing protein [Breznakiella homolactica]|uniref:4Fe-4S binding protein n=1 Tax=Breznakiella homolactica TaxID=2798577 RepID=A0A7T7XRM3_9SPIR|nr:[Fe-Fe] hydrogenase large subunit C-terminal domain-containing protein [Breznakiella homolactica]QQO11198.1 4Fe-4S binding protein [Breznakiella homolactica]